MLSTRFIHAVHSYRFLTAQQIAQLHQTNVSTTQSILDRLADGGLVAAVRRPVLDDTQPDTVYALAQRGANQVAADLGVDRGLVRWRKYHNYVGLPFVEHHLATNDVRIALTVGAGTLGYTLEEWRYEVPIREDVDDPDTGVPPLKFRPDAYIQLSVGPRRLHFFLEVDMATETHARFAQKIRRYLAYKEERLFRYRFGGTAFRMLTAATTTTRVRSLKRVAEGEGARRVFWFAGLGDIAPETIGDPVWSLAGEDEKASLIGRRVARAA